MRFSHFIITLSVLFFLWTPYSHAQEGTGKIKAPSGNVKFRLGIKAGLNFDKTEGLYLNDEYNGYFLGGAFMGLQGKRFRVMGEAYFSKTTLLSGNGFRDAFYKYLSEEAKNIKAGTLKVNELSVPLVLGVKFISIFWLEAGPQYTYVTSLKDLDGFFKNPDEILKEGYFSGVIGLGIELPIRVNLGARYIFGLSDRNNTTIHETWRSNHFQATLGLSIF